MRRTTWAPCPALLAVSATAMVTAAMQPYSEGQKGALDIYPPLVGKFNTQLDNFHFEGTRTFPLKYLSYDGFWEPHGPILLYLGNEGAIEDFYNNTGAMFEWARQLHALVLFVEHRYYGSSMPFGDESLQPDKLRFLSIEQAMADYAVFLDWFRSVHRCPPNSCGTVVLGGSYGGMLAAWFRIKYPHLTVGALAASAPVDFYPGQGKQSAFWNATANTFRKFGSESCGNAVVDAFKALDAHSAELERLGSIFSTCRPIEPGKVGIGRLRLYLLGVVASIAMLDYPVATDFVTPMPARPVLHACKLRPQQARSSEDFELLEWLNSVANLFLNGTGQLRCHNIDAELLQGPGGHSSRLSKEGDAANAIGMDAWNYQACTELILEPLTSDGFGFYPPEEDQLESVTRACRTRYGVEPRPRWIVTSTGGSDYRFASNILFSDGEKDPWKVGAPGGSAFSPTVSHILIEGAAHHEDLRFPAPAAVANPAVARAKEIELEHFQRWLGLGRKPEAAFRVPEGGGTVMV